MLIECLFQTITWSGLGFRGCYFILYFRCIYIFYVVLRVVTPNLYSGFGAVTVGIRATGYESMKQVIGYRVEGRGTNLGES